MYGYGGGSGGYGGGGPRPGLVGGRSPPARLEQLDGLLAAVPYASRPRVRQDVAALLLQQQPGAERLWSLEPKLATHCEFVFGDLLCAGVLLCLFSGVMLCWLCDCLCDAARRGEATRGEAGEALQARRGGRGFACEARCSAGLC